MCAGARIGQSEDPMSYEYYLAIHQLLTKLTLRRAGSAPVKAPSRTKRPDAVRPNGVYFMYENGETFAHNGQLLQRITYVGINETEGALYRRLEDYGRDRGTNLHGYIQRALACSRGVEQDKISRWEVTNYIREYFSYRLLMLPSADTAKYWERKLIPTLAQASWRFASEGWLGRYAGLPYCIWNKEHTSLPQFDRCDMREFTLLIRTLKAGLSFCESH